MMCVQDGACVLEFQIIFRVHTPGNRRRPVQVIASHAVFRRTRLQHRQLMHFLLNSLGHRGWKFHPGNALFEHFSIRGSIVLRNAQLFFNNFQLLTEEKLPLLV